MNRFLVIMCLLMLAACGKKGREQSPWPAGVSLEGLSEEHKTLVRSAIAELNEEVGHEAIQEGNTSAKFQVRITTAELIEGDAQKAGLATVEEDQCWVQLSKKLFNVNEKATYLKAVTWHELGHCAGLGHDPKRGELMFATTTSEKNLNADAFSRFFSQFAAAAGL